MPQLLREIVAHLSSGTKVDARKAIAKPERIAALAATAAFAIQLQRWPGSQNKPTSPQVAAWKPLLVKVRNAAKVLVVRISY